MKKLILEKGATKLVRICSGIYEDRCYGMRLVGQRGCWVLRLPPDSQYVFTGRDPANHNRISVCRTVTGIRSISQIAQGNMAKCIGRCQEQFLLPLDGQGDGRIAMLRDHGMMEVPIVDCLPLHSIRAIPVKDDNNRKRR